MSTPRDSKPPLSRTALVCGLVFLAVGICGFQAVSPSLFSTPTSPIIVALSNGIVAGVCVGLGAGFGKLIDRIRK
jgi:hypothetical protein